VRGGERIDFLDRMLTQTLKPLAAGGAAATFWLNRKGRIDADLLLADAGEEMLVDVDVHLAASTAEGLEAFVFAEDVCRRRRDHRRDGRDAPAVAARPARR